MVKRDPIEETDEAIDRNSMRDQDRDISDEMYGEAAEADWPADPNAVNYCDRCGIKLKKTGQRIGDESLCDHCAKVARDPTSKKPTKPVTPRGETPDVQ